jgi:GABA permease
LRMWLYPWLTLAVIVFIVTSLIAMLFVDQYRDIVMSTGVAAAVVVIIGLVVHARANRRTEADYTTRITSTEDRQAL